MCCIYRNMWNKFSSIFLIMCFHHSVSWYSYSIICSQWKHDITGWTWRQNLSVPTKKLQIYNCAQLWLPHYCELVMQCVETGNKIIQDYTCLQLFMPFNYHRQSTVNIFHTKRFFLWDRKTVLSYILAICYQQNYNVNTSS